MSFCIVPFEGIIDVLLEITIWTLDEPCTTFAKISLHPGPEAGPNQSLPLFRIVGACPSNFPHSLDVYSLEKDKKCDTRGTTILCNLLDRGRVLLRF